MSTEKPNRRQLISSDEAVQAKCQHKTSCSDCPWDRKALNGWLGGNTIDEWIQMAHGETKVECHTLIGAQCAGIAIYRTNVCKMVRGDNLKLPSDREKVFATPMEFRDHHELLPGGKPKKAKKK